MRDAREREDEEREIVRRLLAAPKFVVNGRGYTPWVRLHHQDHATGVRLRMRVVTRDGEHFYAVYNDGPPDAHAETLLGTITYTCTCGDRPSISLRDQLRAIANAIIRDTRDGSQYVARLH